MHVTCMPFFPGTAWHIADRTKSITKRNGPVLSVNILPHDIKSTFVGISKAVVLVLVFAAMQVHAEAWYLVPFYMIIKAPCSSTEKTGV